MEFIDLKTRLATMRGALDERVAAVFEHGRHILGPEVAELEEALAEYVGVKHCVGVASGTDSLLIALMALKVGPGDEVITVPYTWISSAEVIALAGATPVFVDIEKTTWNMDPTLLEAAITERTKAIIPVGIYGQTADMDSINEIAARHQLPVIEDAAQSFGATYRGKKILRTIADWQHFIFSPPNHLAALVTAGHYSLMMMTSQRSFGKSASTDKPANIITPSSGSMAVLIPCKRRCS